MDFSEKSHWITELRLEKIFRVRVQPLTQQCQAQHSWDIKTTDALSLLPRITSPVLISTLILPAPFQRHHLSSPCDTGTNCTAGSSNQDTSLHLISPQLCFIFKGTSIKWHLHKPRKHNLHCKDTHCRVNECTTKKLSTHFYPSVEFYQ